MSLFVYSVPVKVTVNRHKQAELSNANELPRTYVVFLTGVSVNGFFTVQYRGECLLFILTVSVKITKC